MLEEEEKENDLECCGNCRCCPYDGGCDERTYGEIKQEETV